MRWKRNILWGLLILFVALGVIWVFVTRYAMIVAVQEGPLATHLVPKEVQTEQEGVRVVVRTFSPEHPAYDPLLAASFLVLDVEIENRSDHYIDFEYFGFQIRQRDFHLFPFSKDEVGREIMGRFLGSSMSVQGTSRQIEMIHKMETSLLQSARVFPGYKRRGLVVFPAPRGLFEQPFSLVIQKIRRPEGDIKPFSFEFRVET